MIDDIKKFSDQTENWKLIQEYHFGGYGKYSEELIRFINEFKQKMAQGQVDYDDYSGFLTQFRQYLDVEKPSFGKNVAYMLEYQFGYMYWKELAKFSKKIVDNIENFW